jgi:general secretion pathway protein D
VESIAPSTASTADIVTNKREIKTRVLIGNDDVLVLGGLMRDEVTNGENRVPVLGRIPVLGRLFKSTTAKNTKTNLMVFIHPRILEDTNTLRTISTDRYNQLRNRQLQFNDNGFSFWVPGTAPVLPALPEGNSPEPGAPAEPH